MKVSLPTMRRKVGPELPPIWLKHFASASHSSTMFVPGQSASQAPKLPCSSASLIIAAALSRTDLSLPQWRIRRLSPSSASSASSDIARTRRGSKPPKTSSEAGPKDPQRHLREIAVVGQRLERGRRARLGQACFERRRAEAGLRCFKDRTEGRRRHRSLHSNQALR